MKLIDRETGSDGRSEIAILPAELSYIDCVKMDFRRRRDYNKIEQILIDSTKRWK